MTKLTLILILAFASFALGQEQSEWDIMYKQVFSNTVLPKAETLDILIKLKNLALNSKTEIPELQLTLVDGLIDSSQLEPELCWHSDTAQFITDLELFKTHKNVYTYLESCLEDRLRYCLSAYGQELLHPMKEMNPITLNLIDKIAEKFGHQKKTLHRPYGLDFIVYRKDLAEFVVEFLSSKIPTFFVDWEGTEVLNQRIDAYIEKPCLDISKKLGESSKYFTIISRSKHLVGLISEPQMSILVAHKICVDYLNRSKAVKKLVKEMSKPGMKSIWSLLSRKKKLNKL